MPNGTSPTHPVTRVRRFRGAFCRPVRAFQAPATDVTANHALAERTGSNTERDTRSVHGQIQLPNKLAVFDHLGFEAGFQFFGRAHFRFDALYGEKPLHAGRSHGDT